MVDGHAWAELSEGDEFAGYRIERRLGRGGMGILYLALEPGLERRVALKLILPEAAAEEVFARRFAEESRIAASIEHPNVVPIYAAGEQDGVPFIAMRFVSGSDLGKRIARDDRLEPAHAAALIAQVGNGLDAIHAAGLVHRDVKPANVLLSGEDGAEHAYITDFGVARNLATQSGLTQTGRFVGTLDYVAPEQISGAAVDARVDVYALGCLLYKLLTGEVPFPREGEAARLYAHLNDPPPAPSLYVPVVPMALDDVVIRALSKSPDDRYPSTGDLGRAAVAALSGTAVAIPEHTVATGAATVEPRTVAPPPARVEPQTAPPPPTEPTVASPTSAADRAAGDVVAPPVANRSKAVEGRRRLVLAGGMAALVAAGVVAVVLASGGGGGEEPAATTARTTPIASTSMEGVKGGESPGGSGKKAKQAPTPLTEAEVVARGDAICRHSQDSFKEVSGRFANGENEPNPEYSEALVEISSLATSQFKAQLPPASLEGAYDKYVAAQEEVAKWDREALKAAQAGDEAGYLAARAQRNETQEERRLLAEAVGFTECSGSRL
ncbi:MAG: serine/threonine protein kinase [Solirubrobacterales bacterium]|nr:serine/threonine protein kinase [Solirubrobacterales bacterium]